MKQLSQWRTVISIEILGVDLLLGLLICCNVPDSIIPVALAIFAPFALAISSLGAIIGGKSTVEKLANGTGIKGAVAVLMTDKKPEHEV
jgi:hypothetical protein